MPIYTYTCVECGVSVECYVPRAGDRDKLAGECCGQPRERAGVELFTQGKAAFQMAAVLNNGVRIPGHFGKDAARRRKG